LIRSLKPHSIRPLTPDSLGLALAHIASRDKALRRILEDLGPPPLWEREPGFPTLMRIILEQQVSLASAQAAFARLQAAASPLTPKQFLKLDDAALKTVGFSRQKTLYGRNLAHAIVSGSLDLERLAALDDDAARDELVRVKGIGQWTADIYLLMALRRPDIWPAGDRALVVAVHRAMRFRSLPTPSKMESIAAAWRPWRAVAARILWHYYLSGMGKTG